VPNKLSKNKFLALFIQEIWNEGNIDAVERYIAQSYTVYYFANDRIDGHWQIVDRLGVLQQLRFTT
jgi:hypothetical protein